MINNINSLQYSQQQEKGHEFFSPAPSKNTNQNYISSPISTQKYTILFHVHSYLPDNIIIYTKDISQHK